MKKIIILCFSCMTLLGWSQEASKVWSLQECMQYAVENNIQVKQQELSIEDANLDIKSAIGNYLPNVSGNINNSWNTGLSRNPITNTNERFNNRNSSYSLSASIPIFSGMRNYNRLQRQRLQKIANQYNIDTTKDNIRLQLANSYLQLLLQKENLEVLKAQHEITIEQLGRTGQLVDAGTLPKGDLLELEATSATDLQNIANAENSVVISKIALMQILNLELDKEFEIEKIEADIDDLAILEEPVKRVVANSLNTRNEMKLAEQNVQLAETQVKLAKGDLYPTLSGFGNASTSETDRLIDPFLDQVDNNLGFNYGVRVNVPIFSGLQRRNSVSKTKVNTLRSKFQLEQTKQRLTRDVYQAFLDAKASNKAYEAAKVAVSSNELAYEYAKNRYEVGISNSLDFTQAKIRNQNSQVQLIQAKYDLIFKLKLLELYTKGKVE